MLSAFCNCVTVLIFSFSISGVKPTPARELLAVPQSVLQVVNCFSPITFVNQSVISLGLSQV